MGPIGRYLAGVALVGASIVMATGGVAAASTGHSAKGSVARGGQLGVLDVGAQWPGLDPALDTQDAADSTLLNAIYGQLFETGPHGSIVDDEASGYKFVDHNMQVDIYLRHGIVFSDGTPLTAADVASSITRDLLPANSCICDSDFAAVGSVTSSGRYTVEVHLKSPFSPLIEAFIGTAPNWTVDPTALASMGESAYAQNPVGSGPFKVVSNAASATLVLTANKRYFVKGEPYLSGITFTSIGNDQSAYSSLQAHQSDVVLGMTTVPLLKQIQSAHVDTLYIQPATFYEFVSLNEKAAPFNNIKAREALYYATDAKAIVSALYDNFYKITEGPTAPGEPFYEPTVPHYATYNLAKAKSIVSSLGGLTVTLATTANTAYWEDEAQALATMWEKAGITVNIDDNTLQNTLTQLESGNWQALLSNWGGTDPAIALPTYFASNGPFTGIHDPVLDGLINQGAAFVSSTSRAKVYAKIDERMASQYEAPFLYSKPFFVVALKSVKGISSAITDINWETVSV